MSVTTIAAEKTKEERTGSSGDLSAQKSLSSGKPAGNPSKDELKAGFKKMYRLSWLALAYQIGVTVLVGFTAGGSQAMKTEWIENALAIIPIAGVLLTRNTENWQPEKSHPFGHHRSGTIAFVAAAFTLACVGTYLFYDSLMNLIRSEYPSIGGITLFGYTFWHGWLMIGVMTFTAVPPMILARSKISVAKLIHDKPLYACADMNRANWLSNGAGVIGLVLVASGFWWGDSLAALVISLDIMRDGYGNVVKSLSDVMDRHPVDLETGQQHPIVGAVETAVRELPFVDDERTLIREQGRYLFAEIFIQPNELMPPATVAGRLVREAVMPLDWRLQHAAIEFTDDLESVSAVLTRKQLEIEPE